MLLCERGRLPRSTPCSGAPVVPRCPSLLVVCRDVSLLLPRPTALCRRRRRFPRSCGTKCGVRRAPCLCGRRVPAGARPHGVVPGRLGTLASSGPAAKAPEPPVGGLVATWLSSVLLSRPGSSGDRLHLARVPQRNQVDKNACGGLVNICMRTPPFVVRAFRHQPQRQSFDYCAARCSTAHAGSSEGALCRLPALRRGPMAALPRNVPCGMALLFSLRSVFSPLGWVACRLGDASDALKHKRRFAGVRYEFQGAPALSIPRKPLFRASGRSGRASTAAVGELRGPTQAPGDVRGGRWLPFRPPRQGASRWRPVSCLVAAAPRRAALHRCTCGPPYRSRDLRVRLCFLLLTYTGTLVKATLESGRRQQARRPPLPLRPFPRRLFPRPARCVRCIGCLWPSPLNVSLVITHALKGSARPLIPCPRGAPQ